MFVTLLLFCVTNAWRHRSEITEYVAFVNRGSGNLGLFEARKVRNSFELYDLETIPAEPMYVNTDNPNCISEQETFIWVGDRTNNAVNVFDTDGTLVGSLSNVCNGIFHQVVNSINQMWIVCDIDLTLTIIDTSDATNPQIISTVVIDDIGDFRPHDVTANTEYAYATLLGGDSGTGFIVQYSTTAPYDEINRLEVGGDPHVYINDNSDYLYVAAQGSGTVYQIDAVSLTIINQLDINGAHGIVSNLDLDYLYVTDITTTDGTNGIHVIDLDTFTPINGSPFDVEVNNPHNVALDRRNSRLWITNTAAGSVSQYKISRRNGKLRNNGRILFEEEGSLPFGIWMICVNESDESDERYGRHERGRRGERHENEESERGEY